MVRDIEALRSAVREHLQQSNYRERAETLAKHPNRKLRFSLGHLQALATGKRNLNLELTLALADALGISYRIVLESATPTREK